MTTLDDCAIETVQGNILRGYRLPFVRHSVLEVTDRHAARRFLGAAVSGQGAEVPQITTERRKVPDGAKLQTTFNLGFTHAGLRALGLRPAELASFPTEFIEGMARRAAKLSDFGESAPEHWPAPWDAPERVHVIGTTYARDAAGLQRVSGVLARSFGLRGEIDGFAQPGDRVYFGYRDGMSQPRYRGFHDSGAVGGDPAGPEPEDPLGTVLLGQPTRLDDLRFGIPGPFALGHLGTFNAFRVLRQDVFGFEAFLTRTAQRLEAEGVAERLVGWEDAGLVYPHLGRTEALCETVAAQLCGRWRSGMPMELAGRLRERPGTPPSNEFDYGPDARCPVGAHIRRCNPRGGEMVQRIANYTRRIARRGMSYGPLSDLAGLDLTRPDGAERGLLGNFLCASLGAQFEAVMCDWLNLGLNTPDITGSNDPMIGANLPETSWFDLSLWREGAGSGVVPYRIHGLPRFVTTRGGAYTFLPTVTGIRHLAGMTG